jgi:hypothetical protein
MVTTLMTIENAIGSATMAPGGISVKVPSKKMRILPAILLSLSLHGAACAAEVVDVDFANRMAELMQIAARSDELEKSVSQFKSGKERGKVGAKDIGLNHMGLPKGLDASIEGANVALDQRESIKSLEAAECAIQEHADAVHEELVGAILQLAAGLGAKPSSDASRKNAEAIATLEKLVGPDERHQNSARSL